MATLQWTRDDVDFYDGETDFRTTGPGEYDVPDEKADAYLEHRSDGWEKSEDEDGDADAEDSEDEGNATATEAAAFDPGEFTADELDARLDDEDLSDDELETLLDAEREGRDRDNATDVIESRLDEE